MKLLLTSVGAAAMGVAMCSAQTAATSSVAVTATASVVSQYMFRGLRLSSGGFQPSVEAAAGNLTLGAWGNFPFHGDDVPDTSDPEIDFYGAYTVAVSSNLSIAPGFTSYHFPKAPTNAGFYRWTFEPNVALNYTVPGAGVRLTPKIYYDVVLKGATYEVSAYYAYPLKALGSELDFTATGGTYKWKDFANHASPDVKAWGDYWLLGVAAPFQISPTAKITLGFAYSEGREAFLKAGSLPKSLNGLAASRGVATISYSRTF